MIGCPQINCHSNACSWPDFARTPLCGPDRDASEPRNKTLGVVGYGDIGQSTARIARAFGMHILAMRRRTELSESERDSGLKV